MNRTRGDLLADLADSINQLTETRHHTEYFEVNVREEQPAANGRRRKAKRTRRRKAHVVNLPPLLDALRSAAIPGAGETGGAIGGFESRPSAELEPISVLREIIDDAGFWSRTFSIERPTLADTLHAIVSAPHDDEQLAHITRQAARWVKRALLATGFDKAPMTLNEPCPYCFRRHALVVTGDLENAKCTRCGKTWTPDTIGLLADMLRTSETQETAAAVPCWMPDCTRKGAHDVHEDGRGRTWRDTCELDVASFRRVGC